MHSVWIRLPPSATGSFTAQTATLFGSVATSCKTEKCLGLEPGLGVSRLGGLHGAQLENTQTDEQILALQNLYFLGILPRMSWPDRSDFSVFF